MNWYKIAQYKPYKYIGQCDRLRQNDPVGENNWQGMISNGTKVSVDELMDNCDWRAIVDDDEEDLSNYIYSQDSYCAKSIWGNRECYYLLSGGFEFIFVKDLI